MRWRSRGYPIRRDREAAAMIVSFASYLLIPQRKSHAFVMTAWRVSGVIQHCDFALVIFYGEQIRIF